jgi:hypothetical protein
MASARWREPSVARFTTTPRARRRDRPCRAAAKGTSGDSDGDRDTEGEESRGEVGGDMGKRQGIMGMGIRGLKAIGGKRRKLSKTKGVDGGPLESFLAQAAEMGTTVPSRLLLEMTEQVEIEMKEVRRTFQQQLAWRAAERRHPTGRERMGSPSLQTFQDPILLLPWVCFRGAEPWSLSCC